MLVRNSHDTSEIIVTTCCDLTASTTDGAMISITFSTYHEGVVDEEQLQAMLNEGRYYREIAKWIMRTGRIKQFTLARRELYGGK